ncbi:hypothetical protein BHM03_00034600 [Ensete ventricosum]|nr:hypothetical protein BHM03_00034600 [Ensete ventricosum]
MLLGSKVCNFDLYRPYLEAKFAISICIGPYIPVRQVTGTLTACYRAVPPAIGRYRLLSGGTACYRAVPPAIGRYRLLSGGTAKIDRRWSISVISGRLKKKSIVGHRLREKGRRRRGKEERRKKYLLSPRCPRSRVIATLARRRNVSPRVEKDRDDQIVLPRLKKHNVTYDISTSKKQCFSKFSVCAGLNTILLTSFNSCRFHLRGNQSYKILPPYRFSLITTVSLSLLCQKRYSI